MRSVPRRELHRQVLSLLLQRSFSEFVRASWSIVEPEQDLIWGIHIDAVCLHLEAVTAGRIRRLLISMPPGHAKSIMVAVLFPAWRWARHGGWRSLFASYAQDLAIRDSLRCRRLIQSQWYQEMFRPSWSMCGDQNVKSFFETDAAGLRMALGVKGKGTGFRGHCIAVDDPLSAQDAESAAERTRVCNWFDKTYTSRLNDKRTNPQIVIGQRLHSQDLHGHLLGKGGWEELRLASEYEPDNRCTTSIWSDPRTEPGQLLFPELFPREVIEEIKVELGPRAYSAQHQQRPSSEAGNLFRREWWQRWTVAPDVSEVSFLRSIDCNFKETTSGSYICDQLWAYKGALRWLVDQQLYRADFNPMLERTVAKLSDPLWARAGITLVEEAANGYAVLSALHEVIPGLDKSRPVKSKWARAVAVTPQVAAGQVMIPDRGEWVEAYIEELAEFPNAPHDDQVDATSQALEYLKWQMYEIWSGY